MKYIKNSKTHFWLIFALFTLLTSCKNEEEKEGTTISTKDRVIENASSKFEAPSQAFKDYWYAGKAEITSYKLEQARYGAIHQGKAVLIYVTEDFLPNKQVKADQKSPETISVLKLNATKKFNTGIYPYSIMHSTFYPVLNNQHAIKVTNSIQEWCGHTYMQLNNKEQFEIKTYSYFESQGDQNFKHDKAILENELWLQLRINPQSLPTGNLQIIPALEYMQLNHIKLKAYNAHSALTNNSYTLDYPELNRILSIQFNSNFPHEILSWEEIIKSGNNQNAKALVTKATKLETIKSAYWKKNSNKDIFLRDSLKLK